MDITCSDYSKDSKIIATGGIFLLLTILMLFFLIIYISNMLGYDGKIRLWDNKSYLCFSTMEAHDSKITGIIFSSKSKTLLSCSLDGTVKAFDLNKFRCFRTVKYTL